MAKLGKAVPRFGSKRVTALTRPSWATCLRSSKDSPRFRKRRASRTAIGAQAHTTSCRSADFSRPSGRAAIRRNAAAVSGASS